MEIRKLAIILVGLFAVGLLGSAGAQNEAQELIRGYVIADTYGPKDSTLEYLVEADRKVVSEELKSKPTSSFDMKSIEKLLADKLAAQVEIDVVDVKMVGDTMLVTADVITPHQQQVIRAVYTEMDRVAKATKDASDEHRDKAIADAVSELLETQAFDSVTTSRTFELHKEGDQWRVFVDLETHQKIEALILAGKKLSFQGEYDEARANLEEAKSARDDLSEHNLDKDDKELRSTVTGTVYTFVSERETLASGHGRKFHIQLSDPPANWAGKFEATIHEIKLAEKK
jgi:hypothetical protein